MTTAKDLERAREFYEQMFGFEVLSREGWSCGPTPQILETILGSSTVS